MKLLPQFCCFLGLIAPPSHQIYCSCYLHVIFTILVWTSHYWRNKWTILLVSAGRHALRSSDISFTTGEEPCHMIQQHLSGQDPNLEFIFQTRDWQHLLVVIGANVLFEDLLCRGVPWQGYTRVYLLCGGRMQMRTIECADELLMADRSESFIERMGGARMARADQWLDGCGLWAAALLFELCCKVDNLPWLCCCWLLLMIDSKWMEKQKATGHN